LLLFADCPFANRSKNFEKSGEYATAWKKDEDGKMGVDGPRVVVGDQSQVAQAGYITRFTKLLLHFLYLLLSLSECLQLYVYAIVNVSYELYNFYIVRC